MTLQQLQARKSLYAYVDETFAQHIDDAALMTMDVYQQKAFDLVLSPDAQAAFDVSNKTTSEAGIRGRTSGIGLHDPTTDGQNWGHGFPAHRRLLSSLATLNVFQIVNDSTLTGLDIIGGNDGVFGDSVTGLYAS